MDMNDYDEIRRTFLARPETTCVDALLFGAWPTYLLAVGLIAVVKFLKEQRTDDDNL